MEVILLSKVENLGNLGDRVKVRPGYARNYLIPSGRATSATAANIEAFEARRADLERAAREALGTAEARREQLDGMTVTIPANAGNEGKLFGSVGTGEIAEALTEAGVEVHKHEVRMPAGALRQVGEHEVTIHLHTDLDVQVKVVVVAES
jgi:large subunit ribosomal protein L9